jgi:hypothetical protein
MLYEQDFPLQISPLQCQECCYSTAVVITRLQKDGQWTDLLLI